jgi:hypothetical protein
VGSAPSNIRIKSTIRIVEMEIMSALLQEKCGTQSEVYRVIGLVTAF